MPGKNWNSKTGEWTNIVGTEANQRAERAREMHKEGNSIAFIAKTLGVSEARVREYLK